jgi:hypothetical protein
LIRLEGRLTRGRTIRAVSSRNQSTQCATRRVEPVARSGPLRSVIPKARNRTWHPTTSRREGGTEFGSCSRDRASGSDSARNRRCPRSAAGAGLRTKEGERRRATRRTQGRAGAAWEYGLADHPGSNDRNRVHELVFRTAPAQRPPNPPETLLKEGGAGPALSQHSPTLNAVNPPGSVQVACSPGGSSAFVRHRRSVAIKITIKRWPSNSIYDGFPAMRTARCEIPVVTDHPVVRGDTPERMKDQDEG